MSVKELRHIAKDNAVNICGCIEKHEIVNAILRSPNVLELNGSSVNNKTEVITILDSDNSDCSSLQDSPNMSAHGYSDEHPSTVDEEQESTRRPHRKSKDHCRRKSNIAMWQDTEILEVQQLPNDIDGLSHWFSCL
jgi:hypothetical protein